MAGNIRDDIVATRKKRLAALGSTEGAPVPEKRQVPLVPFCQVNGLICEVKRRSPSKGAIAPDLDAAGQAGLYTRAGCSNLSVLTEPEGFGGSLADLMAVKHAFPQVAVLRKDFLVNTDDIDIAYRAGADAVLLIAGMLTGDELQHMYSHAKTLGMEALVEIHDADDLAKARAFKPDLVGINSRDLTSFRIDPLLPVRVKSGIDWKARVIYESGVSSPDQAAFAAAAGFYGLLIGEAVVKNPELPGKLLTAMREAKPARFWPEIGKRLARGKTMVKICGLTREADARQAAELGADILGFVFYDKSPRCANRAVVEAVRDLPALKVGVVVNKSGAANLNSHVRALLDNGDLDAVQFHGDETPDDCARLWPVGYKALRPASADELDSAATYRCPRVLLDASADVPGGSGRQVAVSILEQWKGPLWLAGGITPDNAAQLAARWRPELMDIASGVEDAPGIKNSEKMRQIIEEIRNA